MSYYAKGEGFVDFESPLSTSQVKAIREAVTVLEHDFIEADRPRKSGEDPVYSEMCLWGYENYWEDSVEKDLSTISNIAEVRCGELNYIGEDNACWRFVWKPEQKKWVEQNGRIVYDEE